MGAESTGWPATLQRAGALRQFRCGLFERGAGAVMRDGVEVEIEIVAGAEPARERGPAEAGE
jgi:hypothetical protein